MKILVMCPGSFTHGLDSPERGESRWAQNYAKMLALAGHDVYAASMGISKPEVHYGVKLLNELWVKDNGPYDIYMDASWWKDKKPMGEAKKYIILKWSLEDYTRQIPLAENHYLAYPYPSHHHLFSGALNSQKTFALPTMFGMNFEQPKWSETKLFLPGKIDTNRDYQRFLPVVGDLLSRYPIEGCYPEFFKEHLRDYIDFQRPDSVWRDKLPYDQTLEAMRRCKLSLTVLNPGCTIEAAFQGLPTLFWEHGGFFTEIGNTLGLTIGHHAPPERFTEVTETLLNNKKKYLETVFYTQDFFSSYTFNNSEKYFNLMCEQIF